MNFQVWIKQPDDTFLVFNNETQEVKEYDKLEQKINSFYLPKSYLPKVKRNKPKVEENKTIDYAKILKAYAEQLIVDRNELLNCRSLKIKIDYFDSSYKVGNEVKHFYRTHTNAVMTLFKMLTKKEKYANFEPISSIENKWFGLCNNGGLMYLKDAGTYDCFGYDFKMYYPNILASNDFKFPTKQGKEKTINVLPKHLQFGFYRCCIKSNDERFNKIFSYSKYNVYTNVVLKFARECGLDVDIQLMTDGKPNAYVYEQKDLITGDKIFTNWFKRLQDMRAEMPNNKIIKLLSSSLWGHLSEMNTIYKTEDEVIAEGLNIGMGEGCDYQVVNMIEKNNYSLFELIDNSKNIYKYNFRLKPFITGYGRVKMGNLLKDVSDKLIRTQTDGFILSEPFDKIVDTLCVDAKTTGRLVFEHVNEYHRE